MIATVGDLMSVRTELVLEQLVDRMLESVLERRVRPHGDELMRRLDVAGPRFLPDDHALARDIALAGYDTRIVEVERFSPARETFTEAAAPLALADPERFAAELADAEPSGRPEPGDAAPASWRVPGPGGHVRHYLSLRTIGALHSERSRGTSAPADPTALKRCWWYGFFLRCVDEAGSRTRSSE